MGIYENVLFTALIYWISSLDPVFTKYLVFLAATFCCSFLALNLGLLLAAVVQNEMVVPALSPLILILNLLFGGFYVNTSSIVIPFRYLTYLSYFKWGFEALVYNEFHDLEITCDVTNDEDCLYENSEEILDVFGFDGVKLWENFLVLVAFIAALQTFLYL